MGDNFPNYRHFKTHAGSPFSPPQMKRRSFGTSSDSQGQEMPQEGGQDRVVQPSPIRPIVNPMPDTNWSYTIDPFLDSYSYVVSEEQYHQLPHVEQQVDSPPKRQPKKKPKDKNKNVPKEDKVGTPNKRWEDEHTDELLKILAREAEEGKKCDKAFRNSSYLLVSKLVNEKFGTSYTPNNVINHMRGWKSKWLDIMKAKDMSGAGWDEANKIVILDDESHEDLKKVNLFSNYYVTLVLCNFSFQTIYN